MQENNRSVTEKSHLKMSHFLLEKVFIVNRKQKKPTTTKRCPIHRKISVIRNTGGGVSKQKM